MPANAAIVLADSQPTPVNHTYTPSKIKGDVAEYINYTGDYPLGRETLTLSCAESGQKLRKVVLTLKVPRVVVESINGVNVSSVPDYGMMKIEAYVPLTWTQAQAEDLLEIGANGAKHATVVGMGARGEFVW